MIVASPKETPACCPAQQVVYKHGVVFVSSAGNAGPALSTVGAPGGTSSAILSIGAYVSPALAAAGHSVRAALDKVPVQAPCCRPTLILQKQASNWRCFISVRLLLAAC